MSIKHPKSPWIEEAVAELRRLHADKLSISLIADAMSLKFGRRFTRNSVIGKVHRLGMGGVSLVHKQNVFRGPDRGPRKGNPSRSPHQEKKPILPWVHSTERTRTAPSLLVEAFMPDLSHIVSIFDHREGQCRWIVIEEPSIHDMRYCGAKVAPGSQSWCPYHLKMAFGYRRSASTGTAAA